MPLSLRSQCSPVNGRSVPFLRATLYCMDVSVARHSASLFVTLAPIFRRPGYTPPRASGPIWSQVFAPPRGEDHGRTPHRAEVPLRENPSAYFFVADQRPSAPLSVWNEPSMVLPLMRPVKSRRTP